MAAWVKGGATDAGTAIEAAASLLAKARAPVIAGLSADVAAIRAAYDLAGRIGASVDTAGSAGDLCRTRLAEPGRRPDLDARRSRRARRRGAGVGGARSGRRRS